MPVIQKPTIKARLDAFLRANQGTRYSLAELAEELDCDLSSLPPNCRALAEEKPDVWYVVSGSPGVPAWITFSKKAPA